ncbi:putative DNA-directed RNA polymerase [Helianthus anomalus]
MKKKVFCLVQPVVPYKKTDGINLERLFPVDLLQESDNLQLRVVNYILYYDPILEIWDTRIQLVRTSLVELGLRQKDRKGMCFLC